MARLSAATRRRMSSSEFIFPKAKAYPIPDASHARAALTDVSRVGSAHEKAVVRAAVRRRFPGIKVSGDK